MRHTPTNHAHRRAPRGGADAAFTIIEILIVIVILGILAAFVVPQFSNASQVARENSLKDDLRYLRTQILVFKAQHRDAPPGYPGGNTNAVPTEPDFVAQMTKASNDRCQVNPATTSAFPLGPYIQKVPINPINGQTAILVIRNGLPMPTTYQGATYGWIYKPETQEILANSDLKDRNGVPYMQY
jgi:general secretion pathway protein G